VNCERPKISIVTVVKNGACFVEQTILSVGAQTFTNREYIVIDGGSTDGTLDIIRKHGDSIDSWVSEPDRGLYDAMNKGIRRARGDWIHLLNADDRYVDRFTLEAVAERLADPGRFYYFSMIQKRGRVEKIYRWKYRKWQLWYSAYLPHPTMFVSREAYRSIGGYDTRFPIAADHDMILRLIGGGVRPVFVDRPVTSMRIGGRSSLDYHRTFQEFRDVTVKNGLNPFLANALCRFKIAKYGLLCRGRHPRHV